MNNDITNIPRLTPVTGLDNPNNRHVQQSDNRAQQLSGIKTATVSQLPVAAQQKRDAEQSKEVTAEDLQSAVKQGNALFQAEQRNLQIEVDDSTKKLVVKVVDKSTGDVVRQIPTKEVLSFLKQIQEQQGGKGAIIKGSA